ncbi:unnamed protein product [Urochloa decumbens]|uniref:Uncharacterized protein n=1 Tax=Urochloa decumbens TaxID=240449 RepID=A0ABC8W946_9POAL
MEIPPREEENMKQNNDGTLKKGCLHDAELLMDQSPLHTSCSSSRSGDAQEEAPFDGEERSLRLKMDNKPEQSCSGDCVKIAHDEVEDELSDRKTSPVVEDELHSDKVGVVHATIEDCKQEQGRAQIQALLGIDDHTLSTEISYFLRHSSYDRPKNPYYWSIHEPQQLIELYQRIAFYRIRGYELSVDRKLDELDDANLAQCYPLDILSKEGYFKNYEDSLEWYFDPELCNYSGFEDYQWLVLHNDGEYRDWDRYQSTLHTYKIDLAYVQYCEAIEKETKWIEDYLSDMSIPAIPWERVKDVAHLQALKIAAGFRNVPPILVLSGFGEHMWSVMFDFNNYMGLDGVYFEIWKRVAKQKRSLV